MPNYCFEKPREYGERAKALRKLAPQTERILWKALSALRQETGLRFRRQHPVPPYFADFACVRASLIIELDGPSHDARQDYDSQRDTELRRRGWTVMRFSNEEVEKNLEGVVMTILKNVRIR